MKKKLFVVLLILFLCFTFIGCDKDKEAEETNEAKIEEKEIPIKGEKFETEVFSMIVAEGFTKFEIDGGIQAYKGNDVIEVWVRGYNNNEADIKNGAENLSKNFQGTEPQKVQHFGLDFYKTDITASSKPQTIYVGLLNGQKIQIAITGKDYQNNEILQGMFKSISFK